MFDIFEIVYEEYLDGYGIFKDNVLFKIVYTDADLDETIIFYLKNNIKVFTYI